MNDTNNQIIRRHLNMMIDTKEPVEFEFELLRSWKSDEGVEMPVIVIAGAYPQLDDQGSIIGFAGVLTDITQLRWAETVQVRRTLSPRRFEEETRAVCTWR